MPTGKLGRCRFCLYLSLASSLGTGTMMPSQSVTQQLADASALSMVKLRCILLCLWDQSHREDTVRGNGYGAEDQQHLMVLAWESKSRQPESHIRPRLFRGLHCKPRLAAQTHKPYPRT